MSEAFQMQVPKFPTRESPNYVKEAMAAAKRMREIADRIKEGRSKISKNIN